MKNNPLKQIENFGQSIWLDYIRRDLISSGALRHLILDDGLKGITSNPSIFENAITKSNIYDSDIMNLAEKGKSAAEIYEIISQKDVLSAADEFKPLFDATRGREGFVSLEVNPNLSHDTQGTIEEARRLWNLLYRPNVFIKVPATVEGLPAIEQLIAEGINVNVTLLFSLKRYRQVAEAYIAGIKSRMLSGKPLENVNSVASFFLSRIDSVVDPVDETFMALGGEQVHFATNIRGQVAISCAKIAYSYYKDIFDGDEFKWLAAHGARTQRLLWASTGTKNPDYSDIKYVEALIGANTVNTLPMETLNAYKDHGNPMTRLDQHLNRACWVISELPELGIDLEKVTQKLEEDGLHKFIDSYDKLISAINERSTQFKLQNH